MPSPICKRTQIDELLLCLIVLTGGKVATREWWAEL
jgi:hypothetical protein